MGAPFSDHTFIVSEGRRAPIIAELSGHAINPRNILDIGCGDGAVLHVLADTYPDAYCVGVDTSAANVAAGKNSDRVELVCADYREWRPDRQFDLVVATSILHLLDMSDATLAARLASQVASGGWLHYDLPVTTTANRLRSGSRRVLRALRSRWTDAAILGLGRLAYRGRFDEAFIAERTEYLYLPPHRYQEPFAAELARHGFEQVSSVLAPKQSFVEMTAARCICRKR